MHIWDEKPILSIMHHKGSSKKMDYSHCPLKKRPVHFVKYIKEEMDYVNTDDYAEPENLSTKPQDLSVKCKSAVTAVQVSAVPDVKKESRSPYHQNVTVPSVMPSPYQQQQHHHHHHHHHQHQQQQQQQQPLHPYHPTAVKPGPLEPLCLNIAAGGGDHPLQTSAATAAAFHHHHRHYAPATPRPVPAQYPGTGYLAGYMYHHGGLAAERAFPAAAVTATAVYPPMMATTVRDMSLSPPGSGGGTGSAFKPLHASPSSTVASCSPPMMTTWYGKAGGWSPSSAMDAQVSPPLSLPSSASSSASAVSPSYGQSLPPPPPAVPYHQPQFSNDNDAASSSSNAAADCCSDGAKRAGKPMTTGGRYKCNTCTKDYSTVSGLNKHQQNHCSDDECGSGGGSVVTTMVAAKTFCCKYCDKAYNTLGALKMHIRTHTLPCICKLCGKAFSRPWLLQGHIRTHTGEKPFSCQHCNRAFADRSNLRAHLQTHSDVKKYSCPSCSKTFSRMSLLTKHCDTGCPRLQSPQQQLQ